MGLIQEFQKADGERQREVKQLQDEVANMLKEFAEGDRKRASEVTEYMHAKVGKIRSEVANMLTDFTKGDTERRSAVTGYMHTEVGKIRSEVANMLTDFTKGDTERRSAVTGYMHAEVGNIRSGVAIMMKDLANGSAERASEIAAIRSEVAAIHEMVWGKAPTIRKAVPVVKAVPREASIETAPAGELRHKVFAYLANHPDGTRLTELEEEFGVARIQTARVIRELMDGNKVEKRDLLYFAI